MLKKWSFAFLLIATSLLLFSCGNKSEKNEETGLIIEDKSFELSSQVIDELNW